MAGLFSNAFLEQIRAANDIVEVISAILPLKRAGASFVALCPFHKEKSPSFHVNPQRQIFYCFGCHKGVAVFKFVQEYENISFPEAVRRLAERAGIPLERDADPGEQKTRYLKESLLQVHEHITQHWQRVLGVDAAGQTARDYLAQRRVSEEAVTLFRLGAAPDTWEDTVNWAKNKGFDLPLMEQAGLVLRKEGTDRYYDRFRGRLIFPIGDEQGRVIGFSGRVLGGDEKTAKYVNSPETPIFTKGKVIFGLDKSKRALLDAQCAVICEGQLDLIASFMGGVRNVVAPQGTALTNDHVRLLKRYVNEVVLCFDSDSAGQKATVRSLDALLESGMAIRVAVVPAPHDPDSYIRETGGAAFQKLIDKAAGFFDYYLDRLCQTNDTASDKGRLAVVKAMAESVQKTGNAVLVDTYAQKVAQRLTVSLEAARQEFRKAPQRQGPSPTETAEASDATSTVPRPVPKEFWLLKLLFHDEADLDWVIAHLDLSWVRHPLVRPIISLRLEAHGRQSWQGVPALLAQIDDASAGDLLTEALFDPRPIPNVAQLLNDVLLWLRNQYLDQQLMESEQRASQPDMDEGERRHLVKQQKALRQLKQQPLQPLPDA